MKIKYVIPFLAALSLSLPILMAPILLLPGCATIDPGSETFVVRVEQTQQGAQATFDFVLRLDNSDRGFWRTNAPAFHNFAEWLRQPVVIGSTNIQRDLAMQLNVQRLKVAYKQSRTAPNSNALFSAAAVLSEAVSQSQSWSNIVSHSK